VGRIGGEEFVALLPGVSTETALDVAERVRRNFAEAARNVGGQPIGATVSAGTACALQCGYDLDALYTVADAALYRAKQNGRNRVEAGIAAAEPATRHGFELPPPAVNGTVGRA
jgi:diguanylate cyclase (GGDEF)-like protein